ncbi:hypothetical protein H1R20_g5211, partial [Candolleomyces eurysporus]
MSSAIDSLWDDPVVEEIPKRFKTPLEDSDAEDSPRPAKRARQSLFLPGGSDDEDAPTTSRRTTRQQPDKDIDIDAIFDGIDDIDDVAPMKPLKVVNADELERQMEAEYQASRPTLTPHQILPSSSPSRDTGTGSKGKGKGRDDEDGEKKPKRRPMLLNEGLLLGPTGFPQLIKDVKDFKVKGKGHEASDLNRLLGIYQFWSHKMYPKTQFRDTVSRVEKLCHSKRMQVALSVWRDEAKGVTHRDDEDEDEDMETDTRQPSQPEASREGGEGPGHDSRSSSPPPSRPSTSASEYDVDDIFDDDLDTLLREEQESANSRSAGISSSTSKATVSTDPTSIDEDDGFWAALDDMGADLEMNATSKPPPPKEVPMDDGDQDMWDIVDEVARESANAKAGPDTVPQPSPPRPPPPPPPQDSVNPDDWDDMYL